MARSDDQPQFTKYTFAVRRQYSELIRQHGARGARELLSRQISLNTLLKIAKEFGIELRRGKRTKLDRGPNRDISSFDGCENSADEL